jgi:hypothetical protein
LPGRLGVDSEGDADPVFQNAGGAGKMPFAGDDGSDLVGTVAGPPIKLDARARSLGDGIGAGMAVAKLVVAVRACADAPSL